MVESLLSICKEGSGLVYTRLWVQIVTMEKKRNGDEMQSVSTDADMATEGTSAAQKHVGKKTPI